MKPLLLSVALLIPTFAHADSYILGAGRWTCQEIITAQETEDMITVFQVVGWLMGYWSAETKYRDDAFVGIVAEAGGEAIYNLTLDECRKLPGETQIYELTNSIIGNTG